MHASPNDSGSDLGIVAGNKAYGTKRCFSMTSVLVGKKVTRVVLSGKPSRMSSELRSRALTLFAFDTMSLENWASTKTSLVFRTCT